MGPSCDALQGPFAAFGDLGAGFAAGHSPEYDGCEQKAGDRPQAQHADRFELPPGVAELYRDGCIVRASVPAGGTLPLAVELGDSEGTEYRLAEPPEWHGSEGVLGKLVYVPPVPESATELRVRARFKDGAESETAISL